MVSSANRLELLAGCWLASFAEGWEPGLGGFVFFRGSDGVGCRQLKIRLLARDYVQFDFDFRGVGKSSALEKPRRSFVGSGSELGAVFFASCGWNFLFETRSEFGRRRGG